MTATITLFRTTPRIVMGLGAVNQAGQEALALSAHRVLVVTDGGIIAAGILDQVAASLKAADVAYEVFSDVSPDPRYETVGACLKSLGEFKPEAVIGVGGGSAIDIAKCTAVMLGNSGTIEDYMGVDMVPKAGVPSIIIPTTAGTGSEVTPIAILSDENEKLKKGVVSQHLFPHTALLDPELTTGLPQAVTAATGMDALIHAIEAFTSVNASGMSDMLAVRAIGLIYGSIRTAYAQGGNMQARSAMMEGSLLAGMAFANAGVTAVHAFAYPIGAEFHIPHGVANSIMLPPVMEFNMLGNLDKFARIAETFGEATEGKNTREKAQAMVDALHILSRDLKIPAHLGEFGVKEAHIPDLAAGVMKVTRLLDNNPRRLTQADAEAIYRKTL
jgi:alcohol dehydrogenase